MGRVFKSQSFGHPVYKLCELPIYITYEFDFFRYVEFNPEFYGRTASTLFNDNLRFCSGRYSKLFPGQKLSYWADSSLTARAEIRRHGAGSNVLQFWSYDDSSSTFPVMSCDRTPLVIIDGRKCGVQELIDKIDNGEDLSVSEKKHITDILAQKPDCLAFDSRARKGGENFIFFEKGFRKLALREVKLRFSKQDGGNSNTICCAVFSDYEPRLESYGQYFLPKVKIKMDKEYLLSEEYLQRKQVYDEPIQIYQG